MHSFLIDEFNYNDIPGEADKEKNEMMAFAPAKNMFDAQKFGFKEPESLPLNDDKTAMSYLASS